MWRDRVQQIMPLGEFDPQFGAVSYATLAIVVALLLSNIFLTAWVFIYHISFNGNSITATELLASSIGTWTGFLGSAYLISRTRGTNSMVNDYSIRMEPIDILIGIFSGVVLQYVILPLAYLPLEPLIPHLQQKLSGPANQITGAGHGASVLLVGLILVVGAPFAEEVFFRGLLLQSIAFQLRSHKQILRIGLTVLLSSLGFGIAHAEPLQLLGLFLVGIVLAILRIVFDRLGPTLVTHATFNFVTFIALTHHI